MKLERLKRRAKEGSDIILLMIGGGEIQGKIIRFEESIVVISQNGREREIFESSILGYEVAPTARIESTARDSSILPPEEMSDAASPRSAPNDNDDRSVENSTDDCDNAATPTETATQDDATLTGMAALERLSVHSFAGWQATGPIHTYTLERMEF